MVWSLIMPAFWTILRGQFSCTAVAITALQMEDLHPEKQSNLLEGTSPRAVAQPC